MISCLLVHLSRNAQGLSVRKETVVSGESLTIGRGADCKIHLQDHQVYLHHATIKRSDDGVIYLESERNAGISLNGLIGQSVALSVGARIEIGPYQMEVLPPPDGYDIGLSVELLQSHQLERAAAKMQRQGMTIGALGISKRKLGAALVVFILFAFLLVPLLPKAFSGIDQWQSASHISLAASWSAGDLSAGHAVFGAKCTVCHQQAFREVGDGVCTGCHKNITGEADSRHEHNVMPDTMHCHDCHKDHKGKSGLAMPGSSRCVECHAGLKQSKDDTQYADAADFGKKHPVFRIGMAKVGGGVNLVAPDDKASLIDKTGLKLSHKIHMAEKGIAGARSDIVMKCRDCHRLEDSGEHFAPIEMKRDCQQSGCHRLYYGEPVDGRALHGPVSSVTQYVRDFYFNEISTQSGMPHPECRQLKGRAEQRMLDCVNILAQQTLASSVFRKDMGCGECHEITQLGDTPADWQFAPVKIARDWYPTSVFSHAKHNATECIACHDKKNSSSSADISMPDIEKCRECHTGENAVKYKVASGCDSCHQFHGTGKHVWKKQQEPVAVRK
ncbi:MAG: FHA domain-containing protein [Gammaproteobacteria bacterium]|nr:FHA domain-containing protein [Gammaproteobacteria bacterium]MBU1776640.1 FHA domain-containing protein [Gammaproteobacteria bacterium]MBU1969865.1 FHA domain-containing protein [Gammaproteobacteria bacterium]